MLPPISQHIAAGVRASPSHAPVRMHRAKSLLPSPRQHLGGGHPPVATAGSIAALAASVEKVGLVDCRLLPAKGRSLSPQRFAASSVASRAPTFASPVAGAAVSQPHRATERQVAGFAGRSPSAPLPTRSSRTEPFTGNVAKVASGGGGGIPVRATHSPLMAPGYTLVRPCSPPEGLAAEVDFSFMSIGDITDLLTLSPRGGAARHRALVGSRGLRRRQQRRAGANGSIALSGERSAEDAAEAAVAEHHRDSLAHVGPPPFDTDALLRGHGDTGGEGARRATANFGVRAAGRKASMYPEPDVRLTAATDFGQKSHAGGGFGTQRRTTFGHMLEDGLTVVHAIKACDQTYAFVESSLSTSHGRRVSQIANAAARDRNTARCVFAATVLRLSNNCLSDAALAPAALPAVLRCVLAPVGALAVLDLGHNHLTAVPPLEGLTGLRSLSLHCNKIADPQAAMGLRPASASIRRATFYGNPAEQRPRYRAAVLFYAPFLTALDGTTLTPADAAAARHFGTTDAPMEERLPPPAPKPAVNAPRCATMATRHLRKD